MKHILETIIGAFIGGTLGYFFTLIMWEIIKNHKENENK